jgi:threonine aldolase
MRRSIAEADVGDDVFGEDPTVNRLQEKVARLLGKEASLFVPSGTMGNEISIKSHTQPGDEVICEAGCHILNYESGAASLLSGIQMRPISAERGLLNADQIEENIQPSAYYLPRTAAVTIENTHNSAGGTIYPVEQLRRIYEMCRTFHLPLHLDGARIWNAAVATGTDVSVYGACCDSITVCFSKGLGAPVGSAVAGTRDFFEKVHRYRKMFGGGMRQAGLLAAGALYALENNYARLADDHENAKRLAQGLQDLDNIAIDIATVETNIVIFDIAATGLLAAEAAERLRQKDVLLIPFGRTKLRAVTHMDVSKEAIDAAIVAFQTIFA